LIFDSVTFLDEIEDSEWRKKLLRDMARVDAPLFSTYEELADDYEMLHETGVVQILNPTLLNVTNSSNVALATIADLTDSKFIELASKPLSFGLPARPLGKYNLSPPDKLTWQVFKGKIASPLLTDDKFIEDKRWTPHIIQAGIGGRHWVLSYEAGSAAVTNFYLEAAEELQLTPITTSQLHHDLVLRKLKRVFVENDDKVEYLDNADRRKFRTIFGQGEIIQLFGELFPVPQLEKVSFAEILKFREETQELRREFLKEIDDALRVIDSNPTGITYDKEVVKTLHSLKDDFKKLESELATIRDKALPALAKALLFGTAGGGALSALVSFLGGLSPAGVVAASALTISGAFFAEAVELWNEKRKVLRNQPSSVSYLAKVSQVVRK
jgi:Ca2+-binding EF-hand superfamily protein